MLPVSRSPLLHPADEVEPPLTLEFFIDLPTPNLITLDFTASDDDPDLVIIQGLVVAVRRLLTLQRLKIFVTNAVDDITQLLVVLAVHPSLQSLFITRLFPRIMGLLRGA